MDEDGAADESRVGGDGGAAGGDPLQVAEVFGLSEDAAVRYATNALALLHPPDETETETTDSNPRTA